MIPGQSKIQGLFNENRWLSNFWGCVVKLDGVEYPSVEHAYQAAKTLDPQKRIPFRFGKASDIKKLGKTLVIRSDWDDVKIMIMADLLRQKFSQFPFKQNLLKTGDAEIVEENYWHDNFWGICSCSKCRKDKMGTNNLGILIMLIRDEIRGGNNESK